MGLRPLYHFPRYHFVFCQDKKRKCYKERMITQIRRKSWVLQLCLTFLMEAIRMYEKCIEVGFQNAQV